MRENKDWLPDGWVLKPKLPNSEEYRDARGSAIHIWGEGENWICHVSVKDGSEYNVVRKSPNSFDSRHRALVWAEWVLRDGRLSGYNSAVEKMTKLGL